jgi:hypothetical protein
MNMIDILSLVVGEAETPGEIIEPTALLTALNTVENPIAALSDNDQANVLFGAFESEFGFIKRTRITGKPLQDDERSRWSSLIRWLIRELRIWRDTDPFAEPNLCSIFVVAQANDLEGELWGLMAEEIGDNLNLMQRLQRLIRSRGAILTVPDEPGALIWEREAVESFKAADKEGDWEKIIGGWRAIERHIYPSTVQIQCVRCLRRFKMGDLVAAINAVNQTVVAMQLAYTLPREQRLELAVACDNPYVQLSCMYQTLLGPEGNRPLSSDGQNLLKDLLLKVAGDGPRWAAWMRIFNAYPALQIPLGRALADVPEAAIGDYIDSIALHAIPPQPNSRRRAIAECLRAFRATATQARKTLLWNRTHEHWSAWRFDEANKDAHLFAINWCDLDYGIVAFACDCMTEDERTKVMDSIRSELRDLEYRWYSSVTDIITAWNRLLSRFQPYAHASLVVNSGEEWLTEEKTYFPFEPSKNEYVMMKFAWGHRGVR